MSTAIAVERVTKEYRLGEISAASLSEDFSRWSARLLRKPDPLARVGENRTRLQGKSFLALNDISFQVKEGEVLGVIGGNGAGKSTLLKILSQITAPTTGTVRLRGRVASLLEVGTGFHPDLSGRENIYLNGAILGMSRAEVRRNFDAIVAFSGCDDFVDTPVKRYSSGMYVRLAFAVAAHLESELLIVDEVLAVGDMEFQRKCLGKMRDASMSGRTVLFVSHSMSAVSALCDRALLLTQGRIEFEGEVASAVERYQEGLSSRSQATGRLEDAPRTGTGRARFRKAAITPLGPDGQVLATARTGCDLRVDLVCDAAEDVAHANVAVEIWDARGTRLIDVNTAMQGEFVSIPRGGMVAVQFHLRDVLLRQGEYLINLWIGRSGIESMDHVEGAVRLTFHAPSDGVMHTEVFPGAYVCRFAHTIDLTTPHQGVGSDLVPD
jgi:lipopolysaccharide transport system ATP-binding protein